MRNMKKITWACTIMAVAPISASADVFTFQPSTGNWNLDANWLDQNNQPGTPGANDVAIIPAERVCTTNGQDVEAAVIEIQRLSNPDRIGYIYLTQGSSLKLHGDANCDSLVDGVLLFLDKSGETEPGTLIIMNDLTVDGVGAIEAGAFAGATHVGVIKGDPNAATPPVMTITRDSDTVGLAIAGAFDLEVKLVNDGFVIASGLNRVLTLKGETKSGGGTWGADQLGDLKVDVGVTGTSETEWVAGNNFNSNVGRIIINKEISGVAGDVNVMGAGVFSVTENFCTTGDIAWTGGSILVDEGSTPVSAVFGVASCP